MAMEPDAWADHASTCPRDIPRARLPVTVLPATRRCTRSKSAGGSPSPQTAVREYGLGVDPGAVRRAEKRDDAGNVVRPAQTTERRLFGNAA